MDRRRILVIAGSDSSGGAGLEADQKVIAAHGCYAMTATTALTAQNTQAVWEIHYVPSDFVVQQINACIRDIGVDVVKIGMLASASTVDAVAHALKMHGRPITVVDPVMVSTNGAQLLPNEAVANLRTNLLPLTTILTPNIPEAELLLRDAGIELPPTKSVVDIANLARFLQRLGPLWVLVKGGHLPLAKDGQFSNIEADRQTVVNVLCHGPGVEPGVTIYETDYIRSNNTHGTGCSLASAIASGIALSQSPYRTQNIPDLVESAIRYVEAGILTSTDLGRGPGPINHFHSLTWRHPPPSPSNLRRSVIHEKMRTQESAQDEGTPESS